MAARDHDNEVRGMYLYSQYAHQYLLLLVRRHERFKGAYNTINILRGMRPAGRRSGALGEDEGYSTNSLPKHVPPCQPTVFFMCLRWACPELLWKNYTPGTSLVINTVKRVFSLRYSEGFCLFVYLMQTKKSHVIA